jgi:Tfp pilus assembly protein PilF
MLDRFDLAESALERALANDPGDFVTWNLRGVVALRQGRESEAIEYFERSLIIHSDQPGTRRFVDSIRGGANP